MSIKSMSKGELASSYGITLVTLHTWFVRARLIDESGEGLFTPCMYRRIRVFTPKQVEVIFDKLGQP